MDDLELLRLLRSRDQRGLDQLLVRHGPLLRYILCPILDDPREREECLSDVALQIWERADQFDPERGSLTAWLSAIARNTALNRLRAARRGTGDCQPLDDSMLDPAPGPEEELLRKERTQRLLLAVRRMSEIDCSLFYRKYYYLQSAAQMAAELGLTERGVEGRLRRIRLRLRKELGGEWNV